MSIHQRDKKGQEGREADSQKKRYTRRTDCREVCTIRIAKYMSDKADGKENTMEGMEETNARVAKVLAPYYLELIRKDIQREKEEAQKNGQA